MARIMTMSVTLPAGVMITSIAPTEETAKGPKARVRYLSPHPHGGFYDEEDEVILCGEGLTDACDRIDVARMTADEVSRLSAAILGGDDAKN